MLYKKLLRTESLMSKIGFNESLSSIKKIPIRPKRFILETGFLRACYVLTGYPKSHMILKSHDCLKRYCNVKLYISNLLILPIGEVALRRV